MMPQASEGIDAALRDAAQGSREAFTAVSQWCEAELQRYCRSRLRISDIRIGYDTDLVNDAMFCFWREINKRQSKYMLITCDDAWHMLLHMSTHIAADRWRHENRRKRKVVFASVDLASVCQTSMKSIWDFEQEVELKESWKGFFESLSESDRDLVERYFRGDDIKLIAADLGQSYRTVYRQIHGIQRMWKKLLESTSS